MKHCAHITKDSGFALILALGFLSFVFLLAISMSGMLQVSIKESEITLAQHKAKMNAKLAMNIAIAQLQKYAGPDQRITARTDILARSKSDDLTSYDEVENPYFTGVWDVRGSENSNAGDAPKHNRNKKPTILVSGNHNKDIWSNNGSGYINENTKLKGEENSINIVSNYINELGQNIEVNVPVEEILNLENDSITKGRIAYWVADEGIKARVNLYNHYEANNSSVPYRWKQNQSASISLLRGSNSLSDGKYSDFDANTIQGISFVSKLLSIDQLKYWSNWNGNPDFENINKDKFHDITFISRGVLSDVKNGGLKRNLTYAMTTSGSSESKLADSSLIFERASDDQASGSTYIPYINPTWGKLRDYINIANSYTASSGSAILLDDYFSMSEFIETKLPGANNSAISPIITRFQFSMVPAYVGAAAPFRMYMCFSPSISLWNPYDVPMKISNMMVLYKPYGSGGPTTRLTDGSVFTLRMICSWPSRFSTTEPKVWMNSAGRVANIDLPALKFYIQETIIPPGRNVIFSPDNTTLAAMPTNGSFSMKPGFNPLGYYYHDTGIDNTHNSGRIEFDLNADHPTTNTKGIRDSENLLYLLTPDYSANASGIAFTVSDKFILNQIKQLSGYANWGDHRAIYNNPSAGSSVNLVDTSSASFQSPQAMVIHSMLFASNNAGGLNQGAASVNRRNRWLIDQNPRATLSGGLIESSSNNIANNQMYYGGIQTSSYAVNNFNFPSAINDPTSQAAYTQVGGLWTSSSKSPERAVLFDLPESGERFTSITQLTHANLLDSNIYAGGGYGNHGGRSRYPAFPLGNSYMSMFIPDSDLTSNKISSGRSYMYDASFLLNDVFYDQFYLTGFRSGDTINTGSNPLPNRRLSKIGGFNLDDLNSYEKAFNHILLDGAFNVNSTSVEAWASFLGGLKGTDVEVKLKELTSGSGLCAVGNQTPVVWTSKPYGGVINETEGLGVDKNQSLVGFRVLSDVQIRWLAKRIVEQVKARGPFPSMSAFVNRYFHSNSLYRNDLNNKVISKLKNSGALQSALDSSLEIESSVNKVFWQETATYIDGSALDPSALNQDAGHGMAATGIPGYVTQAHILSQIDSAISVRSDTFTIKAYGDTMDADGIVKNKVFCEAVVQRIPQYVDESDQPHTSLSDLSSINAKFGRKFRIVSYKWFGDVL